MTTKEWMKTHQRGMGDERTMVASLIEEGMGIAEISQWSGLSMRNIRALLGEIENNIETTQINWFK